MSAREQYEEFLDWLKAKRKEIADVYWDAPDDARKIYRQLLLKTQSEIWLTENSLRRLEKCSNECCK